jgi:hypothetical protein
MGNRSYHCRRTGELFDHYLKSEFRVQQTKYFGHQAGPKSCGTIRRRDGEEISFKGGPNGEMVDGPDAASGYCNLKLAITQAMYACAADISMRSMPMTMMMVSLRHLLISGPYASDEVHRRGFEGWLELYD